MHCQLTVSVMLTAGNVRHNTEICFDVRWLRLHSVLQASPVLIANLMLQPPSPSTDGFQYIKVIMFADFDFSLSSILIEFLLSFWTVSGELRQILFPQPPAPHKTLSVKYRPVCCPPCSDRHTASVISRIKCFKLCLAVYKVNYLFLFYI